MLAFCVFLSFFVSVVFFCVSLLFLSPGLFSRFSFSFLLCLFLVLSFLVALFSFLFSVLVLLCFLFLACLIWFRFGLDCFACFVFYSLLRSSSRARLRIYDGDGRIGVIVILSETHPAMVAVGDEGSLGRQGNPTPRKPESNPGGPQGGLNPAQEPQHRKGRGAKGVLGQPT